MPDSKMPDSKMPDSKVLDSKMPDSKMPDSSKKVVTCAQFAQRHLLRVRDVKRAAKRVKLGQLVNGTLVFREDAMLEILKGKIERVYKLRERKLHFHVLAVDDDPENVETVKRILRKKYKVFTASSGAEALEIFRREEIEVIIADQRMPQMNGTEFLKETLTIQPNVIRIILSAYSDTDALTDAINSAKVHHFLNKPITREELTRKVEAAFEALSVNKHVQAIELGEHGD